MYSDIEGVDPLLVLSLMIQESNCKQGSVSSSSSVGLMQIEGTTFKDICEDNIEGINSFEDVSGEGNEKNNIACGVKILKNKYDIYRNGVKESEPYKNNNYFKDICDNCISQYPKYELYLSWNAALRGYNGWGCNPIGDGADVDYVEHITSLYSFFQ